VIVLSCGLFGVVHGARFGPYKMTGGRRLGRVLSSYVLLSQFEAFSVLHLPVPTEMHGRGTHDCLRIDQASAGGYERSRV
jgi:hypothetical protein